MNRLNPRKLLNSKWTAVAPVDREKHFVVTGLRWEKPGRLAAVEIEAVLTGRRTVLPWPALQDAEQWRMGWQ